MMHARLFAESAAYRAEHFTTCPEDRPLFVQFCANDPAVLQSAARHVDGGECDYVDLNLGCPQRIAKRGHYGAFLMDDLPTVKTLVETLHKVCPAAPPCVCSFMREAIRAVLLGAACHVDGGECV